MTLLDLLQPRVTVTKTGMTKGGEYHSSCLKCGGKDRFMFWPLAGNFFCRGCGWKGDTITILREIDGLSFREAAALVGKELPETDRARRIRERTVQQRILTEYWQWYHVQLITWTDRFMELSAEIATAEIGYRAVARTPELYTETEIDYWERCLAMLYDERATIEHICDLLTYDRYEQERFDWWQRERKN